MNGQVSPERTGWRDEEISRRHRCWGVKCAAVDLDFVLAENNFGEPAAIVEYKHYKARPYDPLHPTYRAQRILADNSKIPFLVVRYWPDCWAFEAHPLNEYAEQYFREGEVLTERQFVLRQYKMRGHREHNIENTVYAALKDELPSGMLPF